jgi:hypothetical protein
VTAAWLKAAKLPRDLPGSRPAGFAVASAALKGDHLAPASGHVVLEPRRSAAR